MENLPKRPGINIGNWKHFFSVVPVEKAIFSRRAGVRGRIIFGYSVVLRLFGIEILKPKK
jgi:hypothetical protein